MERYDPYTDKFINDVSDTISRQEAIDAVTDELDIIDHVPQWVFDKLEKRLRQLPPAQSDQHLDEWCIDCKEYDKEKHSCPRWNRVIRQTLQDAQLEPCEDDPRADVYYLAEKIGINQLYALVVQLRGEPEPCEDAVSRAEVLRMINCINDHHAITPYKSVGAVTEHLTRIASNLQPVTPKQRTDTLKAEIKRMKRTFKTCINSDYYTGYMSALSAVEGYIAQLEGAKNESD